MSSRLVSDGYAILVIYAAKGTFVQGERRCQVYLDYAEPQPKVHLYELISNSRFLPANIGYSMSVALYELVKI